MNKPFRPDDTDLAILDALQDDIPLVSRPWKTIADRLGITEPDLIARMRKMEEEKIIRGISPVLESRHLGLHAATLVAFRVPEERIHEVVGIISSYPQVSHNFQRDHEFNIWFTIAAPDPEGLRNIRDGILQRTGIQGPDVLDLPTKKKIKIDVRFSLIPGKNQEIPYGPL